MELAAVQEERLTSMNQQKQTQLNRLHHSENEETFPPLSAHLWEATRGTHTPCYAAVTLLALQTNLSNSQTPTRTSPNTLHMQQVFYNTRLFSLARRQ